jgi:hypothetical protein
MQTIAILSAMFLGFSGATVSCLVQAVKHARSGDRHRAPGDIFKVVLMLFFAVISLIELSSYVLYGHSLGKVG